MKIYLAGSCASDCRTEMTKIGKELRNAGFTVYCPFELKIDNAWDYTQEEWAQKVFDNDVTAIDSCDIFVMISPGRVSTAGTNWEQGYAYAKGKTIIVFQYTREPASLMTYCGCDNFTALYIEDEDSVGAIAARVALVTKAMIERDYPKSKTSIVLT